MLTHVESPTRLWDKIENDPKFLSEFDLIITDFYFDRDPENGLDVARKIKSLMDIPIYLLSNSSEYELDTTIFDGCYSKDTSPEQVSFR